MSTAMNFGSKTFKPQPPEKGAFPLDHFGECKSFKEKFMKCLIENASQNHLCREVSKEYLECRMERNVCAGATYRSVLQELVYNCNTEHPLVVNSHITSKDYKMNEKR
uniref:Cytochrome c oxidase assembly factor COX19 n=1 Tax=Leptobrachium leishanense TaxID=445787 RepID=A0A8C5QJG0_9ANUR